MKVGLFDHVEHSDRALATVFDERIAFAQEADQAGFWCLHVAEHHCSPLNMVPVPGLYMSAVARATKRLRVGPMVYLLPLYSPLRLAEEICMLDHLSKGRLEVGVGRGVSPFELGYHKVKHEDSRDIFKDAYECLKAALSNDPFSYESGLFSYQDVPMPLRPLQNPMPPFWYASSNDTGSQWAGEHGLHFVTNGPTTRARANIDVFRAALAARGAPAHPRAEFSGGLAVGVSRQIVVADTDEEARRIAEPAAAHHHANLTWLMRRNANSDLTKRLNIPAAASFEDAVREGTLICGSPQTVLRQIEAQVGALGINYLVAYMFFGTMTLPDALRSLNLFRSEVMPKLEGM